MTKELDYLEELKEYIEYFTRLDYVEPIVRGEVHQKFKDIYWNKLPHLDAIEEALVKTEKLEKVWRIVKEKDVDLRDLKAYFKVERGLQEYNKHQYKENELTQEEFDLLKEMLEND